MNATSHNAVLLQMLRISKVDSTLLNALQLNSNSLQALAWLERRPRPVRFLAGITGMTKAQLKELATRYFVRHSNSGMVEVTRTGQAILKSLRIVTT